MIAEIEATKELILVTNDDGIDSDGFKVLADSLRRRGELYEVAPSGERSGASHSLTLRSPIRINQMGPKSYSVSGTPADAVFYALRRFMPHHPDWVVSGINRGPNVGEDTLFSGTVGAASIGAMHQIKAIAVSLNAFEGHLHWETASRVVLDVMGWQEAWEHLRGRVLNINVPNIPYETIKGFAVTSLSHRLYSPKIEVDPADPALTWYAKDKAGHDGKAGSDNAMVEEGYVSLSVLQPSLLDVEGNGRLLRWVTQQTEKRT